MDGCGRNQVINQDTPTYKTVQEISKSQVTRQKFYTKILMAHVEFGHTVQHDYNHKLYNQKYLVNYRKVVYLIS